MFARRDNDVFSYIHVYYIYDVTYTPTYEFVLKCVCVCVVTSYVEAQIKPYVRVCM